jgi:DNA-binding MltR family transcriptional regulator
MRELDMLKNEAKLIYLAIREKEKNTDHLDCGNNLTGFLQPEIHILKEEFNELWNKIMEKDPFAPESPFILY